MSTAINPALTMSLAGVQALDAGAGTGKTYSIALLHVRLILAGAPIERILVTTFTETAAAELRERLRRRLSEARAAMCGAEADPHLHEIIRAASSRDAPEILAERLDQALSCFDLAPVRTIHGFCHLLLRDYGLELGADDEQALMANDPSLERRVGDYMTRLRADATEETITAPDASDFRKLAAKFREYNLDLPAVTSLEEETRHLIREWQDQAETWVSEARRQWHSGKKPMLEELTSLVEAGVIQSGEFDLLKNGKRSWTKRENAEAKLDAYFLATGQTDYGLPGTAQKFLPRELQKKTVAGHEARIKEFINRHSLFAGLELVDQIEPRADAEESGARRFHYLNFLAGMGGRGRQGHRLFSDLINAVFDHLNQPSFVAAVRDRFDAVMVDESQDTDARQIEIFRQLFAAKEWLSTDKTSRALIWVGDPKQSIFRFRGADIETYIRAKSDAHEPLSLRVNYRSDRPLVAAINALFTARHDGNSVFSPGITFSPAEAHEPPRLRVAGNKIPPAFCLHFHREQNEARAKSHLVRPALKDCARQIAALLESGLMILREAGNPDSATPVTAGDIAVLTPISRNLEEIRHELNHLGVPSAYRTDRSIYKTDEARDVGLLLRALSQPQPAHLRSALMTPLIGMTTPEIIALNDMDIARAQSRWVALRQILEGEGPLAMMTNLLREDADAPALARLAGSTDGERRLTNYLQLAELLQHAWQYQHARSANALRDFLGQRTSRATESDVAEEEATLRLETDAPAVVLSTIHKAKGLQYPIVFLPTLWLGQAFKSPSFIIRHDEGGRARLMLPGDPGWSNEVRHEERQEIAQQMRLFYVALTRAKYQVHVWWGRVSGKEHAPFARLFIGETDDPANVTDDECLNAFYGSMARFPEATWEMVEQGKNPEWLQPSPGKPPSAVPGHALAMSGAATWTRTTLSPAPLSSSYSALLIRQAEDFLEADELEPTDPEEAWSGSDLNELEPPETNEDVLSRFVAGNQLGNQIHHAFEVALNQGDTAEAARQFEAALGRELPGLLRQDDDADPKSGSLSNASGRSIARTLWQRTGGALLGDTGFHFSDLLQQPRATEWSFSVPFRSAFTPEQLAAALRQHGQETAWGNPGYIDRVRALGFLPREGYFEGVVDLITQLPDGRWMVLDYKSNRLDSYQEEMLAAAMAEHHYLLQALLYSVALKRWLCHAETGWDYERGMTGVAYLFVRGLQENSSRGVWFAKPPLALITAVEKLLCQGKGS